MTFSSLVATMSGSMSKAQRLANRRILLGLTLGICLLVMRGVWNIRHSNYQTNEWHTKLSKTFSFRLNNLDEAKSTNTPVEEHLPCYNLPGADDIVVVMKTTATESRQKIPIHLSTTFRCTPNYLIYSDMSETILSHQIHDILLINSHQNHTSSNIYNRIQESNHGENQDLLASLVSNEQHRKELALLDRHKYFPMLSDSLQRYPEKKWFIFIEATTYLSTTNLLPLLSHLNSSTPLFLGNRLFLDEIPFAAAGSGIIFSNAAVRQFDTYYGDDEGRKGEFEDIVRGRSEGDVILSLGLNRTGVEMVHLWPNLQGENVGSLDYTVRQWCRAGVTWFGMGVEDIKAIWDFEMGFISRQGDALGSLASSPDTISKPRKPFLHSDIFNHFIAPFTVLDQHDWDNHSPILIPFNPLPPPPNPSTNPSSSSDPENETYHPSQTHDQSSSLLQEETPEGCWAACMDTPDCIQWWYSKDTSECKIGKELRLGKRVDCGGRCVAGWIGERVGEFRRTSCGVGGEWVL